MRGKDKHTFKEVIAQAGSVIDRLSSLLNLSYRIFKGGSNEPASVGIIDFSSVMPVECEQ